MKTAAREKRKPDHGVNRAHGAVGQNRSRSIKWAAKQEKVQPEQGCFFLTSPFIELLEVNEAMVSMLGYASREELLPMNLGTDIVLDPTRWKQLFEQSGKGGLVEPIEMEWKGKDHTILKVLLSGRQVVSD